MLILIIISLGVFAFFVYRAYKARQNFKTMSGFLTAGISLAVSVLVLKYYYDNGNNLLFTLFRSVKYGISAISMNPNPDVTKFFNDGSVLSDIYNGLLYFYYIAGPVCASAFIFSFSRSIINMIKTANHNEVHVFSELNDATKVLAESIRNEGRNCLLMFCSFPDNADKKALEKLTAANVVFSEKKVTEINLSKNKKYTFYLLGSREDTISQLTSLCSSLTSKKKYNKDNVLVRYSADLADIEIIREIDKTYSETINLRPVNTYTATAINSFRQYSSSLVGKKEKNVMIIGFGAQGHEFLRNATTLLIEPENTVRIQIVDKSARRSIAKLKAHCPEIVNLEESAYLSDERKDEKNYDITFYEADITENTFFDILERNDTPDLIFIVTDNDKLNYEVSRKLMRFYAVKNNSLSYPNLCVRIRSSALKNALNAIDGVHYFGSMDEVYDVNKLLFPELEDAAKRVHMAYLEGMYKDIFDKSPEEQEQILKDTGFYSYVNYDSSFNEALALEFKYEYISTLNVTEKDNRDFVAKWLSDENNLYLISDIEHLRWNTYQRFQGWSLATPEQEKLIAENSGGKTVKSNDLLLHPALVSIEDLPKAEETADALLKAHNENYNPTRYVTLDRDICRRLLTILQK